MHIYKQHTVVVILREGTNIMWVNCLDKVVCVAWCTNKRKSSTSLGPYHPRVTDTELDVTHHAICTVTLFKLIQDFQCPEGVGWGWRCPCMVKSVLIWVGGGGRALSCPRVGAAWWGLPCLVSDWETLPKTLPSHTLWIRAVKSTRRATAILMQIHTEL